jgi:S-DNA-T family DNA segregation ATPase FtsK/SpoIIIE
MAAMAAAGNGRGWPLGMTPSALGGDAWRVARKHPRWVILWVAAVVAALYTQHNLLGFELLAAGVAPALLVAFVSRRFPNRWRRHVAAPRESNHHVKWAKNAWPRLSEECNLTGTRSITRKVRNDKGKWVIKKEIVVTRPQLKAVTFKGSTLTMTIGIRLGQTFEHLAGAADAICAAAGGLSYRIVRGDPGILVLQILMVDHLTRARDATMPSATRPRTVGEVTLGRREDSSPWTLAIVGKQTLVAGCSGSGKGSMFWGIAGGLAPSVPSGLVQLWAVDLKGGIEVGMGRGLFCSIATNHVDALTLLGRLATMTDERAERMAGVSRSHVATKAEPLHVLMIDEYADLMAYADAATKKLAEALMARLLTKGRAVGVCVVACVQDPRKEIISNRGLFTQTVVLRMRSKAEGRLVLPEATSVPVHLISPDAQGTAYVVADDGSTDRVRANYWPDDLIRAVASRFPSPQQVDFGSPTRPAPRPRPRRPANPAADRATLAELEADLDTNYGDFGETG